MNVKEMTWALARAQNKSSAGWYDVSCCSWEYHDARRYSVMFTSFRALTVLQSPPPRPALKTQEGPLQASLSNAVTAVGPHLRLDSMPENSKFFMYEYPGNLQSEHKK